MNKSSTRNPLNFNTNENNVSFSDSTDSFTENQYDNKCKEEKKISYYDHDVSDLELGYTKKQSCEYYDDVKRNLNFDDDDEDDDDEEEIQNDISGEKIEQVSSINFNQKASSAENPANSLKNVNGAKSLNSSMSNSGSLNSIVNSSKVANTQKPLKKNNLVSQNVSNSSLQNRSMVSFQMSPNQKSQQGSGKNLSNIKDTTLVNMANHKTAVKHKIADLANSNKRVWK